MHDAAAGASAASVTLIRPGRQSNPDHLIRPSQSTEGDRRHLLEETRSTVEGGGKDQGGTARAWALRFRLRITREQLVFGVGE